MKVLEKHPGLAGAGGVLFYSEGNKLKDYAWGIVRRFNNGAKWLALIKGLELARNEGIEDLVVFGDSMLVIREARNLTKNRKSHVTKTHRLLNNIVKEYKAINFLHLMRSNNKHADTLENIGAGLDCGVLVCNQQVYGNIWVPYFCLYLVKMEIYKRYTCIWKWHCLLGRSKILHSTSLGLSHNKALSLQGNTFKFSDPPRASSTNQKMLACLIHMATMQRLIAAEYRGISRLNVGWESYLLPCVNIPCCENKKRGRRAKILGGVSIPCCVNILCCVEMGEAPPVSGLSSLQCLLCRKHIVSHGRITSGGSLKPSSANEVCQAMVHGGLGKVQHTLQEPCKVAYLGHDISFLSCGKNDGSSGSASGFASLPDEVQTYIKDMEAQVRTLRGENFDLKRAISHLYSLIQTTNADVRCSSNKITGQVASLAEILDKGCPCSINLDVKIIAVHSNVRVVEAKIDNMRAKIKNNTEELKGDVERTNVESVHK